MQANPLKAKIADYCNYVNLAVKNFREKNYSDSALNSRKAAEAACKIIIYHAFNDKVAENKIFGKSLRELIVQLIRDGKTKKEAINHIETLQLIGNRAAHDNVIIKDEAAHCLNGLNLLTDYLFNENLKISTPSALNFDFGVNKETEIKNPEVIEKIIIQEKIVQQKIDEETKAQIINEIKDLNQSELRRHEALIDKNKREIYEDIEKQNKAKQETEHTTRLQEGKRKKKTQNRLMAAALASLVLLAITVGLFFLNRKETAIKNAIIETPLVKHPDTVYVAINAIHILQDNPQMEFKIEDVLISAINLKLKPFNLPFRIIKTDFKTINLTDHEEIIKSAKRLGYDLVYFGDLYENSFGDSAIFDINGRITENSNVRSKKIKFKSLLDSSFIKEINDQGNVSLLYYVYHNIKKRPYPELIKILTNPVTYSEENFLAMRTYKADLQLASFDFKGALKQYNDIMKISSRNYNYNLFRKGCAFTGLKLFDSAEVSYKKVFVRDSLNVEYLLSYAALYLNKRDPNRAKIVLNKILRLDKNNKQAQQWLSDMQLHKIIDNSPKAELELNYSVGQGSQQNGRYQEALEFLNKTYLLDPNYKTINALMASCYFNLGDIKKAMFHANAALLQDSTNQTNTFLYASLLAQVTPENKAKVMHYYDLSMKINPRNLALHQNYVEYLKTVNEIRKCIDICELSHSMYPRDLKIARTLAGCYLVLKDYRSARPYYEFLNTMTPNNEERVGILAECYLQTCPGIDKEFQKGLQLAQLAVDLNPNNGLSHLILARFLQRFNNLKPATEHYERAKALDKEIYDINLERLLK